VLASLGLSIGGSEWLFAPELKSGAIITVLQELGAAGGRSMGALSSRTTDQREDPHVHQLHRVMPAESFPKVELGGAPWLKPPVEQSGASLSRALVLATRSAAA